MEKFKVELLPAAWDDLQEIFEFIFIDSPKSAENTFEKIMQSLHRLEHFPLSGALVSDKVLRNHEFRMVVSSPYISFYRLVDNVIYVYHIVHGARDYKNLMKAFIT